MSKKTFFWYGYAALVIGVAVLLVTELLPESRQRYSKDTSARSHPQAVDSKPRGQGPATILPEGILALDADVKETMVTNGESEAHFLFNFTNITKQELFIYRVDASCGCTVAKLPQLPWSLPPGSEGKIPVTMKTSSYTGKSTKSLTIRTSKGVKTISVIANIQEPVTNGGFRVLENNHGT